ncbi:YidE/YbjL duplication [Aminithiophilus ramosus]|uniref:YidE/YbjL duplication n=2 Tax=Synergistales TaxID=649776 RepID=A0A9Q7ADD6_9BACT|nr:YidE/YbjL duplication [Aminithiophilus ramosus]QTX32763.1 YidE/YbjL duplication [Aminithiophilus ramosus]QVL36638.1 YidE/YbjL duplication [Synergistota bacterium]
MIPVKELLGDPLLLLSLAVVSGYALGRLRFGRISLGLSGALFTGLLFGMAGGSVPREYFSWNLLVFVVAVGLLASEDIVGAVRLYGWRFPLLSLAVTFSGALVLFFSALFFGRAVDPFLVVGTYTGALTSSPGLGAALEATGGNPLVVVGYTVAYPFGVVAVVLFVQLAPIVFAIDVEEERRSLASLRRSKGLQVPSEGSVGFSLVAFALSMALGSLVGAVKVPLPGLGSLSLGATGGALLVALAAGTLGRVGPLAFRMDPSILGAFRSLSLAFFLAASGLMAGPQIVAALSEHGLLLIAMGLVSALFAEAVGYFMGRRLWKMNWILLSGAICGAMTSTPGLGAAIDATGSEECAAGYGAAYPVAIVGMVLFTSLLHLGLRAVALSGG